MIKSEYKQIIDKYSRTYPSENKIEEIINILFDIGLTPLELSDVKDYMVNVFTEHTYLEKEKVCEVERVSQSKLKDVENVYTMIDTVIKDKMTYAISITDVIDDTPALKKLQSLLGWQYSYSRKQFKRLPIAIQQFNYLTDAVVLIDDLSKVGLTSIINAVDNTGKTIDCSEISKQISLKKETYTISISKIGDEPSAKIILHGMSPKKFIKQFNYLNDAICYMNELCQAEIKPILRAEDNKGKKIDCSAINEYMNREYLVSVNNIRDEALALKKLKVLLKWSEERLHNKFRQIPFAVKTFYSKQNAVSFMEELAKIGIATTTNIVNSEGEKIDSFNVNKTEVERSEMLQSDENKGIFIYDDPVYFTNGRIKRTYCDKILKCIVPADTTEIENIAFCDCTLLNSISIPESVSSIGKKAFYNCSSLTSIEIPDAVEGLYPDTFWGCKSLKTISIPNTIYIEELEGIPDDCEIIERK